jgi:tetratricopeptide (TPR) repeat protein
MSDDPLFEQELLEDELREEALDWWQRGYEAQMRGDLDAAVDLYSRSIEIWPTAEAYTFRGWARSFQGRIEEAIQECHKAIEVDPDYGNPYNDIGAYLIQLGDFGNAIPWLERALEAKRYECYFYPHFNLGRIYEQQGRLIRAMNCYKSAYDVNNQYTQALQAFRRLQSKLN